MASDLATALISGQNTGLMADPALAAIAPQLQMAQALSTQGMSTAPAYPAQALGRLGQALAGSYLTHDAQSQLTGLNAGSTESLQKVFPEGSPMGDALRSPSPMVRMLAMQQAGKALLLNSESKTLGPNQVQVAPATPQAAGGVVGAGSPALGGMAEAAKNPALVARAGGVAGAEYPYKPVERIVQGPQGPERTNLPLVEMGGAAPGAPAAAPTVAAAGAPRGEPVKTPEFQGNVAGQEKLYGSANEAIGKVIGEAIERGGSATRDKLHALDTMESALRAGGDHIVTGPLAEHALKAKQLMSSLGLDAGDLTKGLPETEVISKMNAQLASASAKAMTGRPTQAEFQIWMRNNPGLMTSKQGTLALIDVLRQQAKQDTEFAKVAMNKKNWENFPEVADKWYQEHGGLINPLTNKPMRDEIAAARGGQGGSGASPPGGGGALAAGATRAAPAATLEAGKTIVNNHLYIGGNPNDSNNWQVQKGDRLK